MSLQTSTYNDITPTLGQENLEDPTLLHPMFVASIVICVKLNLWKRFFHVPKKMFMSKKKSGERSDQASPYLFYPVYYIK